MKKQGKALLLRRQQKHVPLRATAGTVGGFASTTLFAFYNGVSGILYASIWHGSIGIYYILLSVLRWRLFAAGQTIKKKDPDAAAKYRKRVFCTASIIMLFMNIILILPVSLMVLDQRPVQMALIPAIASAAYTIYKVSLAAVNLRRAGNDLLLRNLRAIQLIDALVSVLTLQNTLIIAVDGSISQRLFYLVATSSAGILLLIFVTSLVCVAQGLSLCRKAS